jgi:hypothetical protein
MTHKVKRDGLSDSQNHPNGGARPFTWHVKKDEGLMGAAKRNTVKPRRGSVKDSACTGKHGKDGCFPRMARVAL